MKHSVSYIKMEGNFNGHIHELRPATLHDLGKTKQNKQNKMKNEKNNSSIDLIDLFGFS